jgi:hypothetical protein
LAGETLLLWDRHIGPVLYDRILELYDRAAISGPRVPTPGAGPFNPAGLIQVASGRGVYLCLGVAQRGPEPTGGVAVLPVSDADATIDVCVVSRKGETAPAVAHFLACVSRVFPGMASAPALAVSARAAGF